jgi:ubiquitin C-terminal hydrolase
MELSTKGYSGLVNLGNTCFLNSCLQVLSHTYELTKLLNNAKRTGSTDQFTIVNEWNDLRNLMWSQDVTVAPSKFVLNVQRIAKTKGKDLFTGWSQNDMPEFLLFFIDCIHESQARHVDVTVSGKKDTATDELALACYTMLKESYAREFSEVMELFYGISISEIISLDGTIRHACKPESFFIMDLPMPSTPNISIYDCLDLYTQPELLTGDNAWFNEKTGKKEDIQKRISFWNFPKIIVITLKRFSPDGTQKRGDLVTFPMDDLDLAKYVRGYSPGSYQYELYAVCNHMGNVYRGHYTAFVKNYIGEWVHYNDNRVERLPSNYTIVSPMAYCLFYRKKNNTV